MKATTLAAMAILVCGCGGDLAEPEWPTEALKCLPELEPAEAVETALEAATAEDPREALLGLAGKYAPEVALCSIRQAASQLAQNRSRRGAAALSEFLDATGVRFED